MTGTGRHRYRPDIRAFRQHNADSCLRHTKSPDCMRSGDRNLIHADRRTAKSREKIIIHIAVRPAVAKSLNGTEPLISRHLAKYSKHIRPARHTVTVLHEPFKTRPVDTVRYHLSQRIGEIRQRPYISHHGRRTRRSKAAVEFPTAFRRSTGFYTNSPPISLTAGHTQTAGY